MAGTAQGSTVYGRVAVSFHWIIAILIITNILIGLDFPDPLPGQKIAGKPLLGLHISIGLLVLVLSVARLGWRLLHRSPPHDPAMKRGEVLAAGATHLLFYIMMIGIPLTGWLIMSAHKMPKSKLDLFGVVPWPHFPIQFLSPTTLDGIHGLVTDMHGIMGTWLLPALLALHVGAVIKHHLIDHDPILWRMLPLRRYSQPSEH